MDISDPYCTPSLVKARDELKKLIAQLKLRYPIHRTDGSLSSLNIWEGEAGMMEHIQSGFPMPILPPAVGNLQNRFQPGSSQACTAADHLANTNNLSNFKANEVTTDQSGVNQAQVNVCSIGTQKILPDSQNTSQVFPNSSFSIQSSIFPIKSATNLHKRDGRPHLEADIIVIDDDDDLEFGTLSHDIRSPQDDSQCSSNHPSTVTSSDYRNQVGYSGSNFNSSKNLNAPHTYQSSNSLMNQPTDSIKLDAGGSSVPRGHLIEPPGSLRSQPCVETRDNSEAEGELSTEDNSTNSLPHMDGNLNMRVVGETSTSIAFSPRISISQERQPLADLVFQDETKAAELYTAKIEEWASCIRHIQSILNEVQGKLGLGQKLNGSMKKHLFASWREVCFVMECLHVDMEIERMALSPKNTGKYFVFPLSFLQIIGKSTAVKIFKSFDQMKATLFLMRKDMQKLYRGHKKLFCGYNRFAKNSELKLKIPVLPLLSENNHFHQYRRGQPLILPMTPGLYAGLYGNEKSLLDRCKKCLTHTNNSVQNKLIPTAIPNTKSLDHIATSVIETDQQVLNLSDPLFFHDSCSPSSRHINDSGAITATLNNILIPGGSGNLQASNTSCSSAPTNNYNTNVSQQPSVNLKQRQPNESDVNQSEIFRSKILEWEMKQSLIKDLLHSTLPKTKNVKNISDHTLKTLADIVYLIEHSYYQMELERIMQNPDSTGKSKKWNFSTTLQSKLGAEVCHSFIKRYNVLLLGLKRFLRTYLKFLKPNLIIKRVKTFNKTNKRISKNCLILRSPHLVSLRKSGTFSKIMTAQTSKKFVKPFSEGLETALFGIKKDSPKLPSIPGVQPFDLSFCEIVKYDESSLKDRPQLYREFKNTCNQWKLHALELEKSLKKNSGVLNCPQKTAKDSQAICQAFKHDCSLLQSLCMKFMCLKYSIGQRANLNWANSTDLGNMMGEDASNDIYNDFNKLHKTLSQVGINFYRILFKNRDVITTYNQEVDNAHQVQLPILIDGIECEVKELLSKGTIPMRSLKETISNSSILTAQSLPQSQDAKLEPDPKPAEYNFPSVNNEGAQVQTSLPDTSLSLNLAMAPDLAADLYSKEMSVLNGQTNLITKSEKTPSSSSLSQLASFATRPNQPCSDQFEDEQSLQVTQSFPSTRIDSSDVITNITTSSCAPTSVTPDVTTNLAISSSLPRSVRSDVVANITTNPSVSNLNSSDLITHLATRPNVQCSDNATNVQATCSGPQVESTNTCEHQVVNSSTHQSSEPDEMEAKILVWETRHRLVKDLLFHNVERAKRTRHISIELLKTAADIRHLIEQLYFQIECWRMMQNLENKTKGMTDEVIFGDDHGFFVRHYEALCERLKKLVPTYSKLLAIFRKKVKQFDKTIRKNNMKIGLPNFVALSKSDKFLQIMKAQTSKEILRGSEAAIFGAQQNLNQLPFLPEFQPIDLSQFHLTKFDESSLKECGINGSQLLTEIMALVKKWKLQVVDLEKKFTNSEKMLNSTAISSVEFLNACQVIQLACSSLQILSIHYFCLKFSLGERKEKLKWLVFTNIRTMLGKKASGELKGSINVLSNILLRVGNYFHRILLLNKNLILTYNQKVDKAHQVQLPMLICDLEKQFKYLFKKGLIPQRSPKEMMPNPFISVAQGSGQVPEEKLEVDPKLSECNFPSVNNKEVHIQTMSSDTSKLLPIIGPSDLISDSKTEESYDTGMTSHLGQETHDLVPRDRPTYPSRSDGEIMFNILQSESAGEKPLWERLYLLHFDVRNLKDCLILAETSLDSSMTAEYKHCKLILDVSATFSHLQTVLNRERYEAYNGACEDLSSLDEDKLKQVGLKRSDIITIDFQAVEMLMEFLYDHLIKLMEDKLECIKQFFPHAEDILRRTEENYELSKTNL